MLAVLCHCPAVAFTTSPCHHLCCCLKYALTGGYFDSHQSRSILHLDGAGFGMLVLVVMQLSAAPGLLNSTSSFVGCNLQQSPGMFVVVAGSKGNSLGGSSHGRPWSFGIEGLPWCPVAKLLACLATGETISKSL